MRYESDAIVAMEDGKITHFGPATQVRAAAAARHDGQGATARIR